MTPARRRWIAVLCGCLLLQSNVIGCTSSTPNTQPSSTAPPTTTTFSLATTTATALTDATETSVITTVTTTTSKRGITTTTNKKTPTTTKKSTTKKTTTTTKTTSSRPPVTLTDPDSYRIQVPVIAQKPDYPTGCESVSAVMLLKYWGEEITIDQFIDDHLPKSSHFYTKDGVYYGPDPREYFIGDPRNEGSFGCFAPTIQKAVDHFYGEEGHILNVSGNSLEQLCEKYIKNDQPVLVWTTIAMIDTYDGIRWHLEDGTKFTWPKNEHCMVLVGYDQKNYYFNDPYTGTVNKYPHSLCETRYEQLGKQALVINKQTEQTETTTQTQQTETTTQTQQTETTTQAEQTESTAQTEQTEQNEASDAHTSEASILHGKRC